ncbi:hypothetical protein FRC19_006180 [Serendipita sp. 401]|nr:hypothetical protein FRC19_006180 [Serendipita sp. 401]
MSTHMTTDSAWQFTPWFGSSSNQAQGTFQVVTSTVGNNTYVDSLRAGAWSETVWSSAPFVHAGTVPLPTGSNNNYISLAINITYARPYADTIGFYVKEAGFVITTPTVTPGSTTSTPSSSPTDSVPSGGSGTPSKTGAIVGGVVGGVVLIAICVVIGFVIGRRKQKKNANAFPDGVLASPTSNMAQSPGWQNPMYPEQPNNMYRPQQGY